MTDTSATDATARSAGILGGSFNPPHLGHIALARQALEQLALERVVLMPVATPHGKPPEQDPGPQHRLAMCELATAAEAGISVCALEIDRGGPSYTADTLSEIHAHHPEVELTFIVGADTARTLPGWHRPRDVVGLAHLAIAPRPGTSEADVLEALALLGPGHEGSVPPQVSFLSMTSSAASSSLARERLAAGARVEGLLAPAVAAYIAAHGLYRTPVAA